MNLRTGIFGVGGIGIAVLALGGTAIQEAVKGAATTAGARGMDGWLRAFPLPERPPDCRPSQTPPATAPSTPDPQQRSPGPVADVPQVTAPVGEASLTHWLANGDFARALQASRTDSSLHAYAPAADALERFGRLRAEGRPARAQEALDLAEGLAPPHLRSVVTYWRCRYDREIARLDDLPCMAPLREALDPKVAHPPPNLDRKNPS